MSESIGLRGSLLIARTAKSTENSHPLAKSFHALGNALATLGLAPRHCLFLMVLWMAWGLRLLLLGDKSIWWDEGWTVWTIRKAPLEIARWTAADTHPPLYFWLLWGWRALTGEGEWLLRFPSAVAGTLTVAVLIPMGRRLGGWKVAMGAAVLMALHRFAIRWSQEMRMYSLAALFCILSLWFSLLWLHQRARRRAAWGYVLSALLALGTLYLSGMVLAAENVAVLLLLLWKRRRRLIVRWLAMQLAVLIPFAGWFFYALGRMKTWSAAEPFSFTAYLRLWVTLLTTGASAYIERYGLLVAGWMALALASGGAILWQRIRKRELARPGSPPSEGAFTLLLCYLLVPLAAVYLLSIPRGFLYTPRLEARYLLLSVPGFALLMAWGTTEARILRGRWLLLGALVVLTGSILLPDYYEGRRLQDDYISIGAMLRLVRAPDEAVLLHTDKDWPVFAAHYPGQWLGIPNAQPLSQSWLDGYLGPIWERSGGLWLVKNPDALRADPQGEVVRWLRSRGTEVASFRVGVRTLALYRKDSAPRPLPPSPPIASDFLQSMGDYRAGIPLHRMQVGDETALLLCGPRPSTPKAFTLSLDDYVWLEGRFEAELGCELFPLVAPPIPGRHRLTLRLEGESPGVLGLVTLERRPGVEAHLWEGLTETAFQWEGGLKLLGYRLAVEKYRPGEKVKLVTCWQAGERQEARWVLFVHLLGEAYNAEQGNFLWGQRDSQPLIPSTAWSPGQKWVEEWEIPVLPSAPAGNYKLEVGWYELATGRRILLTGPNHATGADHIILGEITVQP